MSSLPGPEGSVPEPSCEGMVPPPASCWGVGGSGAPPPPGRAAWRRPGSTRRAAAVGHHPFSTLFVCVGNLIANLLYGVVDPQIREVTL